MEILNNISESINIISKGGLLILPLLLLSIYSVAVIILKIFQFINMRALDFSCVNPAILALKSKDTERFERIIRDNTSPVAKVMDITFKTLNENLSKDLREAEIMRVGNNEIRQLESHIRGLEMTANISPLVGLLGTVIGMLKAFSGLEKAGAKVDPSVLAGGIWESLITTVGGLMVAVPALAAYYIIDSRIEKIRAKMKDASTQVLVNSARLSGGKAEGF